MWVRRVQTFSDLIFVPGANGTNAVLSNVSFQMYSDNTSYAHPLLLGLAYAMFVDQNGTYCSHPFILSLVHDPILHCTVVVVAETTKRYIYAGHHVNPNWAIDCS